MEINRLTQDGTAEPVSRDQILRHVRGQGNIIFPVQLTTSRIGNLTRLIHTLLYVMTIHIHTCRSTTVSCSSKQKNNFQVCLVSDRPIKTLPKLFLNLEKFLKKNQSTPRPSEHPPVMGEKMSKRLGGIKGCKYKTSFATARSQFFSVYCTVLQPINVPI